MSLLYRSPKAEILLNEKGFIEFIAGEHRALDPADLREMTEALVRAEVSEVRLLISRFNEYGVPADFNLLTFGHHETIRLKRAAIFAPSPGDQAFSHLMKTTAFRDVPCEVFSGRTEAIHWLLAEATEPDAAAEP